MQLDLFTQIKEAIQEQNTKLQVPSDKLYHSIAEVANLFDVNASLLRFWEKEFTQISPKKTSRGDRLYTQKDIDTISVIYYLTRERKFTLEGTKAYLKRDKANINLEKDLVTELLQLQQFLKQWRAKF
jgi:DNA-binding transcriptional MerR regulator